MEAKLIKDRLFLRKVVDSYVLHRIKDGILTIEGDSQYTIGGIEPFYKLSLKNCQAIELGYDLDELFNKVDSSIDYHEFDFTSFKHGANAILEILGNKKFSEEDIKQAYLIGCDKQTTSSYHVEKNIQSLQQTEWDVEIVMGDPIGISDKYTPDTKPKLDENGCLILKRK